MSILLQSPQWDLFWTWFFGGFWVVFGWFSMGFVFPQSIFWMYWSLVIYLHSSPESSNETFFWEAEKPTAVDIGLVLLLIILIVTFQIHHLIYQIIHIPMSTMNNTIWKVDSDRMGTNFTADAFCKYFAVKITMQNTIYKSVRNIKCWVDFICHIYARQRIVQQ